MQDDQKAGTMENLSHWLTADGLNLYPTAAVRAVILFQYVRIRYPLKGAVAYQAMEVALKILSHKIISEQNSI